MDPRQVLRDTCCFYLGYKAVITYFYASVMATVVAGDRMLLSCPYFYESACLSAAPILNLISLDHLEGILSNRTIHCDLGHNAEYV